MAGWDRTRVRVLVSGQDRLGPESRIAGSLMPWSEVARLAPEPAGLWEVSWRYRLAEGEVEVVRWDGPWVDCGTPAQYLWANLAASGGVSVVGEGARVEGKLDHCVVWPGARVRQGESQAYAIRADDYVTVLMPRRYPDPRKPGTEYFTTWFDTWRFVNGKADEHWDPATIAPPAAPAAPAAR